MKYDHQISQAFGRGSMLVRGVRLQGLCDICENQKTISTRRLASIVSDLANDDCLIARQLADLADCLKEKRRIPRQDDE